MLLTVQTMTLPDHRPIQSDREDGSVIMKVTGEVTLQPGD